MISAPDEINGFFQTWMEEFGRAVEMFHGTQPTLSSEQIQDHPDPDAKWLWFKQSFTGTGRFTTWIGAEEATWSYLGGALGEGAPDILRSTYLEILNQAQTGTANVISNRSMRTLSCGAGTSGAGPEGNGSSVLSFQIRFRDKSLPALLYLIEVSAASVLGGPARVAQGAPQPTEEAELAALPMLERLLDLELPVSVALGTAELPIRDVLKMTSGSVVELDKEVGDTVDLIIHGVVVAKGEIVLVKGNYGVRIKQIVSRRDRLTLCSN